eukprot:SAG22_NODE_1451_length_4395_cov_4.435987_3_plen_74_part_00
MSDIHRHTDTQTHGRKVLYDNARRDRKERQCQRDRQTERKTEPAHLHCLRGAVDYPLRRPGLVAHQPNMACLC